MADSISTGYEGSPLQGAVDTLSGVSLNNLPYAGQIQDALSPQQVQQAPQVPQQPMVPNSPMAVDPNRVPANAADYLNGNVGGPADVQQTMQGLQQGMSAPAGPEVRTVPGDIESQFEPLPTQGGASKPGAQDPTVAGLNRAYKTQIDGANAIAQAASLKGLEQASMLEAQEKGLQESVTRMKQMQDKAAADSNAEVQKLKDAQADLQKFTVENKIDPEHFWNSKQTGQKIVGYIALALGGLGGAYTGKGDNKAFDVLNTAIGRDIDAQKANLAQGIETKKQGISTQNSILAQMNRQFDNQMQAESATRVIMLEKAKNQLEQVAAKYSGREISGKLKMEVGKIEEEQVKSAAQFQAAAQQKALLNNLTNGQSGGSANLSPAQIKALPKEYQETYVPGYGFGPNKDAVQAFQKERASLEPAINGANRILALTKDFNRITDVKKAAQISSELVALTGQLREPLTGPGTMQPAEYKRLMDTLGDPTKIASMPSIERVRLQTVVNKLATDLKNSAKRNGLSTGTDVDYGFNPGAK